MKNIIITGASKGLGEGIAIKLIDPEHQLICISRSVSQKLIKLGEEKNSKVEFVLYDLSYTHEIDALMDRVFEMIDKSKSEGLYLINNAGIITPIGPAENCSSDEIEHHIKINLIAPMILSKNFIRLTQELKIQKRILNISSGAAKYPMEGWSSYCTGKAGLNMFTSCVASEQQENEYPVEIMAVAPGIIDTNMQDVIRNTPDEMFIHKNKFIEFKENSMLVDPLDAGKQIKQILFARKIKNGKMVDLREKY